MSEARTTVDVPSWFVEPTFAGRFLAAVTDALALFVLAMLVTVVLRGEGPLAFALSLAPLVVYAGVMFGPLHRGLHDRAARTIVTAAPMGA